MPSATAVWPEAIPITTASANRQRELASSSTRPPYSSNFWFPASQPRAKYDAA